MSKLDVILDTNILYSALHSKDGASFKLISSIPSTKFNYFISVALCMEYEDVLKRQFTKSYLDENDIEIFLDFLVSEAERQDIYFRWRPFLKDPGDDMLVELAVAANADAIVTYNKKDFKGVEESFGIKVIDAKELLIEIGEIS